MLYLFTVGKERKAVNIPLERIESGRRGGGGGVLDFYIPLEISRGGGVRIREMSYGLLYIPLEISMWWG